MHGKDLFVTTTYGSTDNIIRRELWQQLHCISVSVGNEPWVIGGDFNIFTDSLESSDMEHRGPYATNDMLEFKECLADFELTDHPYTGPVFT
ncbi:hypothetical protein V6N13_125065 [Hibiscus sabdariffa]